MAPTASAGEIRAAYRALAREHHPDKHPEGARRSRAVERMAEINAAWSVLSDEAKRRAYDLELAKQAASERTTRAKDNSTTSSDVFVNHGTPEGFERVFDESADVFPISERVSTPIAMAGFIPVIALAVVLVAIFVFTAYAAGSKKESAGNGSGEPLVAVRDLRGHCIQQSGGFILVVNCAITPHEGRIVAQASLGASCPVGTQSWIVRQQQLQACVDPATSVP